MMSVDLRLIAPIKKYDPINDEYTFEVPVNVLQISTEIIEFIYFKNRDFYYPKCRKIEFEWCNKNSQLEKCNGLIWEKTYQKLIEEDKQQLPFLSFAHCTRNLDGYYDLIVYSERNLLSEVSGHMQSILKTEEEKVDYFLRIYWSFLRWWYTDLNLT